MLLGQLVFHGVCDSAAVGSLLCLAVGIQSHRLKLWVWGLQKSPKWGRGRLQFGLLLLLQPHGAVGFFCGPGSTC